MGNFGTLHLLGLILILVVTWWIGWQLYQKLWLVKRDRGAECQFCGRIYKGSPTYCPHCGEVVAKWSSRR